MFLFKMNTIRMSQQINGNCKVIAISHKVYLFISHFLEAKMKRNFKEFRQDIRFVMAHERHFFGKKI